MVVYKLKDYRDTLVFEKEHPRSTRWDDKYKLWKLEQDAKCQGIWIKKSGKPIAEIIMSWESNNVVNADALSVLTEYQRQGIGTELAKEALKWAHNMGFEWFSGKARMSNCWKIFEDLGADPLLKYTNWNKTNEAYMLFKINLAIWQS